MAQANTDQAGKSAGKVSVQNTDSTHYQCCFLCQTREESFAKAGVEDLTKYVEEEDVDTFVVPVKNNLTS